MAGQAKYSATGRIETIAISVENLIMKISASTGWRTTISTS